MIDMRGAGGTTDEATDAEAVPGALMLVAIHL